VTGRVLDHTAIVDITTDTSVYGRAFLVAAVEMGISLKTPSVALLHAWAEVPESARALLELFLDAPSVEVEPLEAATATRAGVYAHPAHLAGAFDAGAAHTVDVAHQHGFAVLTADPAPLRAIDPDISIEELPG
jgi:hypothetical protein